MDNTDPTMNETTTSGTDRSARRRVRWALPVTVAAVASSVALMACALPQGGTTADAAATASSKPSATAAPAAASPAPTTATPVVRADLASPAPRTITATTAAASASAVPASAVTATTAAVSGIVHGKGISPGGLYESEINTMSASGARSVFQDMRSAGVQWVRLDYNYAGNPTGHGGASDQTITQARMAGLDVEVIFGDGTASMPESAGYSAQNGWMTYSVRRLAAGGIHDFEIGNEVNLGWTWAGGHANPAAYAGLLRTVYPIIHQADPQATVLMAGMAPFGRQVSGSGPQGNDYNPIDFIRQMYWNGAAGWFDAVNLHPYTYPVMPMTADGGYNLLSVLPDLLAVMRQYGDGSMPIWWTESGMPTGSDGNYPAFSVAQQQETIKELYQIAAQYPQVGPVFLYGWQDDGQDGDFGLYTWSHQRKASFDTFAGIAAQ
ncbi:hypothetical protein [Curtobacterium sp. MCBD17_028]|uniref:hypothetical protein n=1 Tax=Curtobacterium sp. MCBD17_028 TaxID=2175670 RepID=UPI0011B76E2F|nr:hypothetical protein [Curtobacterium sp. MCBD17_028]